MQIEKTNSIYTIKLTQYEAERLSKDLHKWYIISCIDEEHIQDLEHELAEGEVELGLIFITDLEKISNAKSNTLR